MPRPDERPDNQRFVRAAALGVLALVLVPFAVSAGQTWFRLRGHYFPTADRALLELHARDGLRHLQTLGPYSHWGWNHPGPALIDALAVGYRLFGSTSVALLLTALLINAIAVVLTAWVAYRWQRLAGVITVLVPLALFVHALGPDRLRDPWNPYTPIIPLFLLALCCWLIAVGDVMLLPLAVGVASFVIQCHIGVTLLAVALVAAALAVMLRNAWRGRAADPGDRASQRARRRTVDALVWGALVGVVAWAPVLYGTVVEHDGNVSAIIAFFRDPRQPRYGLRNAFGVMGLQWNIRPHWIFGETGLGGNQPLEPHPWVAVGVVLAVVAAVFAVRRHRRDIVLLAGFVGVAFVASLLAISQIVGHVASYLAQWAWAAGALLGVLLMAALLLAARSYLGRRGELALMVAGVLVAGGATLATGRTATHSPRYPIISYLPSKSPEVAVANQIAAALPTGRGNVYLRINDAGEPASGIVLQLLDRGVHVKIPDHDCENVISLTPCWRMFGDDYVAKPGRYRASVVLETRFSNDPPQFVHAGTHIAHYVLSRGYLPGLVIDAYMQRNFNLQSL